MSDLHEHLHEPYVAHENEDVHELEADDEVEREHDELIDIAPERFPRGARDASLPRHAPSAHAG